mgnify:CR=1 FL=1
MARRTSSTRKRRRNAARRRCCSTSTPWRSYATRAGRRARASRSSSTTSLLATAIAKAFSTALNGTSKERPELADTPLPFVATLTAVPGGGEGLLRQLFEPLGYDVDITTEPLDPTQPAWGASRYHNLTLRHPAVRLRDVLSHVYVLVPVLDRDKHYWISRDEVDKLLAKGGDWLPAHPAREFIARRYLLNFAALVRPALAQLLAADDAPSDDDATTVPDADGAAETAAESPQKIADPAQPALTLHYRRLRRVAELVAATGATRVLDLSCGEGKLIKLLLGHKQIGLVRGMDYLLPDNLPRLRHRNVRGKRNLALREFALGLEGLERFVAGAPLREVHRCVFGVLALESEPLDPRL